MKKDRLFWAACAAVAATLLVWAVRVTAALVRPEPTAPFDGYLMGFNEGHYSSVLRGEIHDRAIPPGYVTTARPLAWLGVPAVVALRLVSLLSAIGLVAIAWRQWGIDAALLTASSPMLILWAGRAQPDALMTALVVGALAVSTRPGPFRAWTSGLVAGIATLVKPPAILALTRHLRDRPVPAAAGALFGAGALIAWISQNPGAPGFHAGHGTPFADAPFQLVAAAAGLGAASVLATWSIVRLDTGAWLAAGTFALFAIAKAPLFHLHYMLPATTTAMILLGHRADAKWVRWCAIINAPLSLVILAVSGW